MPTGTPTPLATIQRFLQPGVSKYLFLPAIAAPGTGPTSTEITAGTDLTTQLVSLEGFSQEANLVETPDMSTLDTSKIPGRRSSPDSSMIFYGSKTGMNDVRTLLPLLATGFIVIMPGGNVSGSKCDVFPIQVAAVGKQHGDSTAFTMKIGFAIVGNPAMDVAIP